MKKEENRRVRMTRSLLRNSLVELMQTQDIHQITVTAICAHADVNRSTFYLYYGSPYELLADIEEQILSETSEILRAELARLGDRTITEADLTHLLTLHLSYVEKNIHFLRAFSRNHEDYDVPLKTMHLVLEPYVAQVAARRRLDEDATRRMFTFMMFGCIGIVKDWMAHDDPPEPKPPELAAILCRFIGRTAEV
ncbi:MAG: TetR/AcrR family transcriptional regulator [Oscillospiraceae bacterium]|nr:TetR/AcrR family transcriptional regulator [Oscillospiraceae bacterium]